MAFGIPSIVNFEYISHIVLMFLLLTFNMQLLTEFQPNAKLRGVFGTKYLRMDQVKFVKDSL